MKDGIMRIGGRVLAEILVIVIGVLIALAVDSWSAQRAEQRTEQVYLNSLFVDVEQDIAQIDTATAIIRRRQASAREALTMVQRADAVRDTLGFIEDLSRASLLWTYQPIAPTFQALKSTGNLQILRSVEVRRAISDYYSLGWQTFHEWVQEVFWTRYRPNLYRHLNAAQVAEQFYDGTRTLKDTHPENISTVPDLDLAGLRAGEKVAHALEMIILTMSQQLELLADQREKEIALRDLLRSAID